MVIAWASRPLPVGPAWCGVAKLLVRMILATAVRPMRMRNCCLSYRCACARRRHTGDRDTFISKQESYQDNHRMIGGQHDAIEPVV